MTSENIKAFLSTNGMYYGDINIEDECKKFIDEMEKGLVAKNNGSLKMIPTYLTVRNTIQTNKPTIVIDAGGTNFRVCLATFDDQMKVSISDFTKRQMPGIEREYSKKEFFNTMVDYTKDVAQKGQDIGFCFSYPTDMDKSKDGKVIAFSKEVKAKEVEGEYVGENLVAGLKAIDGKDRKAVILNDTVATLLGGKGITSHRNFDSYIGFILGTGTNACYIENNSNITKVSELDQEDTMIINMESGGYDSLPQGTIDRSFDAKTTNPGQYKLEKMVSGRYLGPVTFEVLHEAAKAGLVSAHCGEKLLAITDCSSSIEINTFLYNPYDADNILVKCCENEEDRRVIYEIIDAMIERAAKIVTIQLAATILKTDSGKNPCTPVGIVAEGTTFYVLKDFREKLNFYMKDYLVDQKGHYYEFIKGEDLNLIGTAIAALSE